MHGNASNEPGDGPEAAGRQASSSGMRWHRWLAMVLIIPVFAVLFVYAREHFTLEQLAAREQEWRDVQRQHPWLIFAGAFLLYTLATGLSLPIATTLTLAYAWYFGFWPALVLVNFASTAGATFAFLMSRLWLREAIRRRYHPLWEKIESHWLDEGPWYLLTLRVVPIFPFFVVNVLMGLTPIRTRTFWWVSQLGMLPATALYVYAGSSVPSLKTLAEEGAPSILNGRLFVALLLLGTFPLIARRLMNPTSRRS